jgi:hypothetical protein
MYPAKVVAQDALGELSVIPDDPTVAGQGGMTKVPMRHGIPGLIVTIVPGSRCRVFFEDGDPSKPAAALWPDGSTVDSVSLTCTSSMLGSSTATEPYVLGQQLLTILGALTVPTAMGPSGTPINAATFPGFQSAKHKIDA